MVELKGRVVSARQKVSKLLKIFGSPERETFNVSSPTPSPIRVPYRQVNSHVDSALAAEYQISRALMYSQMRNNPR